MLVLAEMTKQCCTVVEGKCYSPDLQRLEIQCFNLFMGNNALEEIFHVFNFRCFAQPQNIFDNENFQIYDIKHLSVLG